jgi:hypothetical protein
MEGQDHTGQARFRIKTPTGEVEVVGSTDFVERRWADVQVALNRIGDRPAISVPEIEGPAPKNEQIESEGTSRRATSRNRSGPSCASRISGLKDSGFFSAGRKASEVVQKLTELATPYEPKHVAAALNHLTKTGRLRRMKATEGDWTYTNP